jgi:hypothetical protein
MSFTKQLAGKIPEVLNPKDWVSAVRVDVQQQIVIFLLRAYGFLLVATMAIFFLQGFHVWGFTLEISLLRWLGGATIGEIGGLLVIAFRASFK